MRGTVYILDADGVPTRLIVEHVDDATTEAEFRAVAGNRQLQYLPAGSRVEFGPITQPWKKVS